MWPRRTCGPLVPNVWPSNSGAEQHQEARAASHSNRSRRSSPASRKSLNFSPLSQARDESEMPTQPRGLRSVHAAESEEEQMSQGVTQPQELSFQTSTESPGQAAGQASSGARGSDGLPQVHSHNPSRGRRIQEKTEPLLVLQARELGYSVPYQATLSQLAAIVGCCW